MNSFVKCLLMCLSLANGIFVVAQSTPDTVQIGLPEGGVFSGGNFDSVQMANGNLHVEIPLVSIPQRGGLTDYVKLVYDNKDWEPDVICFNEYACAPEYYPGEAMSWRIVTPKLKYEIVGSPKYPLCTNIPTPIYAVGYDLIDEHNTTHHFKPDQDDFYYEDSQDALNVGGCWEGNDTITSLFAEDGSGYSMNFPTATSGPQSLLRLVDGSGVGLYCQPDIVDCKYGDSNGNFMTDTVDTRGNLRPTIAYGTDYNNVPQDTTITYKDSDGIDRSIVLSYTNVTVSDLQPPGVWWQAPSYPDTCESCAGEIDLPGYDGTIPMVSKVLLPNGQSYNFTYDTTGHQYAGYGGELTKITLPTGGSISYTWGDDYNGEYIFGRSVASRTVSDETGDHIWTYAPAYNSATKARSINVVNPLGETTKSYFDNTLTQEVAREYYDASGNLMKNTLTYYSNCGCGQLNQRPIRIDETFYDSSHVAHVSSVEYDYEQSTECLIQGICQHVLYSAPVQTRKYDFETGARGALLTTESWTYLSDYNSGYHSLPLTHTISGTGGNTASESWEYDNYLNGISPALGTPNHDYTNFPSSWTSRANSTSHSIWDSSTQAWLKDSTGYDELGNKISKTDARGYVTTYSYDDPAAGNCLPTSNSRAYVTLTTNTLAQRTLQSRSYCTGLPTLIKDENQIRASGPGHQFQYDMMGRLVHQTSPDGGYTTWDYHGYANPLTVSTTIAALPDPAIVSSVTHDSLGRVSSITQSNGATAKTAYDALGRVASVTNLYFVAPSPTDGTSYFQYDALGRKVIQVNPDNTKIQFCYDNVASSGQTNCRGLVAGASGEWTDIADEDGNDHQQVVDGLGRLTEVVEPGGLATTYSYDALNNLRSVLQKGTSGDTARSRSFTYDSLSRLLTSTNPETGTICYGTVPNGTVPTPSNCNANGYDANGNLLYKTDPRGVTIGYSYDALNRLTNKQSSGAAGVPGFSFTYGYDTVNPAVANGIGRLLYTLNGQGETEQYWYDAMGRMTSQSVYLLSAPHTAVNASAAYDLAGNMTDLTYPDGRHIQQTFDGAGRLQTSALHDINGVAQSQSYLTSITYNPDGSPNVTTLGNGVQQTVTENSRLQVASMSASSPIGSSTLQTVLSHTYCYANCTTGGTANNGNIWGIADTLNATRTQGFTYDNLNRIGSFSLGGALNQQYAIDSFGNLSGVVNGHQSTTFAPATNRIANLPCATSVTAYDAAGNQTCDSDPYGNIRQYTFDAESRVSQIATIANPASPFVGYAYGADGDRVRKLNSDGTYTEYVNFGGETIAEKDQTGALTDYIFAGGKRIAKVNPVSTQIHFSGTNGAAGQAWAYHLPFGGYAIRKGDKIAWRQMQSGAAVPRGGVGLAFSDGSYTNWVTQDRNGQTMNALTTQNAWVYRVVDLSADAGKTVASSWISEDADSGAGKWDERFADISFIRSDGTVVSIYNGQTSVSYASFGSSGVTNQTIAVEQVADGNQTNGTHFYLGDHLGTAQMEFAGEGWPLWQGQFAPFGGELDSQTTANHYKFTSKERDAESGLDYFGARYYASNMGRFISPDWSARPTAVPYADLKDPQTLNLYIYGGNNPLTGLDPDGHCDWCQKLWNGITGKGFQTNAQINAAQPTTVSAHDSGLTPIANPGSGIAGNSINGASAAGWGLTFGLTMSELDQGPQAMEEGDEEGAAAVGASALTAPNSKAATPAIPTVPESIPAGPSARPTAAQQGSINEMGEAHGCSTCGTNSPGTKSGNWVGDHQPPTKQNPTGGPQVYKPQCLSCSQRQGGQVSAANRAAQKDQTPQ